ncbi:MAG TPA: S8 family serine peptidase, partial [Rhizomicrobium sp.]|nr:S8 family serine peptidase [Rhizomicrobium sp.]
MINQGNSSTFEVLEGRQLLSGDPWGAQAKLIGQDLVAQQFPQLTGAGESIAIIDSGVDYNHPSLGGGWGKKVVAGWDFASNDADPMSSTYAHGTGTAAMAAATPYDFKGLHYQGIAPGVKIIALRENSSSGVAAAM